jgi:RHS repeat-associated protein
VIALPKGGGAIRGIGEKFTANQVTGTGGLSVPLALSPGRSGFGPELALGYDSGAGNGPFGIGWGIDLPAITRKTDKGVPAYAGAVEDTFILAGAEDLVPERVERGGRWVRHQESRTVDGVDYVVRRYRPRIERLYARIERWTAVRTGEVHWRSISRDNVTAVYGRDPGSRIADPADHRRVFSWLICESHDDTGNAVRYEYKAEDGSGVDPAASHERNRTATGRAANRYLKRIRYGNTVSRLVSASTDWLFEVVFDYGEHGESPAEERPWTCRLDPFSSYRAGFEVRTYRLCRRVLMFHHFPGEAGVGRDCLVRSTDLAYRGDPARGEPTGAFLASVAHRGWRRRPDGGYLTRALPPVELGYTEVRLDREVHTLDAANLPSGLDGSTYRWADLDGDGLAGVLTAQGDAWFYLPNLGGGRLGPLRMVRSRPAGGQPELLDLDGDGRPAVVDFGGPTPGFTERSGTGTGTGDGDGWDVFRPFQALPNIAWNDPNLRFGDLTGDGLADVLVTGDPSWTWYRSLGEAGFDTGRASWASPDEESGPRLVFADRTTAIQLADLSGDGLADLVRIRNGEICYWPSLGHGRFGAKVTMDGAPWLDDPDLFDPARIRLADVDGSGPADLVYLHRDGARLYRNASGNAWRRPDRLPVAFPRPESVSKVATVDLLGTGTTCLVWSSPLPAEAGRPLRYLDLMGGRKPHLLNRVRNNLGAETHIRYAPSTAFYAADAAAGHPWVTPLPFVVHVVDRVETVDGVGRNRLVSRYSYHHGYFDGPEREFRGFGRVDQTDTESIGALAEASGAEASNVDTASHLPPVLTRTWFHTGAFLAGQRISRQFEHEYHRDGLRLPDTVLPGTVRRAGRPPLPWALSDGEARQACRALKGSVLRTEVYALDGSELAHRPYQVTEQNHTVELLQPAGPEPDSNGLRNAVFAVHGRETLTGHYERTAQPRVGHELLLAVDDYGNPLRSATVGYGRPDPDPALPAADAEPQLRTETTVIEHRYTNPVDLADDHRVPLVSQVRSYHVVGVAPRGRRFGFAELDRAIDRAAGTELPYPDWEAEPDHPARRLIEHTQTVYRRDDLAGPLPLGVLEPMALPYQSYRQAFTPELVTELYGDRVDGELLRGAGYRWRDGGWWVPTGLAEYAPAGEPELAHARAHFFRPRRFLDPFGAATAVDYDRYDLLVTASADPLGNLTTVGERDAEDRLLPGGNDYRVLQPRLSTDPNGNRLEVSFDVLGRVAGTAVMGKRTEQVGDSLAGFDPDLDLAGYFADPLADPDPLLGQATTRVGYDESAFWRTGAPAVTGTLTRETHVHELAPGQRTRIQHAFSYTDGFGRQVQRKVQAEPGAGGVPRWVGTGWTIFNNKGRPVRKYEPFFAGTHAFEFARMVGVSPVVFYDPLGRVVATLQPDDSFAKTTFDPWHRRTWDANDTVLIDPRHDPDTGGYVARYLAGQPGWTTWYAARVGGALGADEQRAAEQAARHAGTPATDWLDPLGRMFLSQAHNRVPRDGALADERYRTRIRLDVESNIRATVDARGRTVQRYGYDMLANRLAQLGMETGQSRYLPDVVGKPRHTWNARGFRIDTEYDAAHRPVRTRVSGGELAGVVLRQRTDYGETEPDAPARNLRTRVARQYDAAGVVSHAAYDFKGNLLESTRALAADYRSTVDWAGEVALEERVFTGRTRFDALNRPTGVTTPDGSEVRPTYNEANLLDRLDLFAPGSDQPTPLVTNLEYNARGQRTLLEHGNGVRTSYGYQAATFRLNRLRSRRGTDRLQDLAYTYDPVGNITSLHDDAQQTLFFANRVVAPHSTYTYDALYRLVEATGREHLGQTGGTDAPRVALRHPNDGTVMGSYLQRYVYDEVGNILRVGHRSADPAGGSWTRDYTYAEPSQLEPERTGNRLTAAGAAGDAPSTPDRFGYDEQGNTVAMPGLALLRWDPEDQLHATARQVVNAGTPQTTYYLYDPTGKRVRKVTEHAAAGGEPPRRRSERIYLGTFEVYLEYGADGQVRLERQSVHALDDTQRVALVETRTVGEDRGPQRLVRFQYVDHRGTTALELDLGGLVISHEEYYPFGGTAYLAVRADVEAPKRYRFTGKERDSESGLYFYGARYYAPGLGRWVSCDPIGTADGANLYVYARNNPVNLTDPTGLVSWGTIAVIAAVVVVSVAVTVVTAGVAGPIVAGAAAGVFGSGTVAATVATGVVVGAVAGAAGGAAGEVTRQVASGEASERGSIDWGGVGKGAVVGAAGGAVTGGLGSLATAGRAGLTSAQAATTGAFARSVVRGAAQGAVGGAVGETTREVINGEQLDAAKIATGAGIGGLVGGGVRAASPVVRPLYSPLRNVPIVRAAVAAPYRAGIALARGVLPQGSVARDAAEAYYAALNHHANQNRVQGGGFERVVRPHLETVEGQTSVREQVSVRPYTDASGTLADYRVRLDALGQGGGAFRVSDMKSGAGGFQPNQVKGYPLIEKYGGVVVGSKGGAAYPAGTKIPPTQVDVYREGAGGAIVKGVTGL